MVNFKKHISALCFLHFIFIISICDAQQVISDLRPYLQPNDVLYGNYDTFPTGNNFLCTRRCDGRPKLCYYRFNIELYDTMNPACGSCPNVTSDCLLPQCIAVDGFEKPMIAVNRMYPGPAIQVCKGDRLVIDVENMIPDRGVTIHWHGIRQRGTPYMDGANMVTQCPINGGESFRYNFVVDTAGTFFWHSHAGLQKEDGIQGPLIVRDTEGQDYNRQLYDADLPSHTVFVTDWLRTWADSRVPGLLRSNTGQMADAFLVNGRGILDTLSAPTRLTPGMTPMAVFNVTRGRRYRFRFIGATCLDCAVDVSIQSHKMSLINTDGGNPVRPEEITSITLLAGDRFDVVINANQNIGTYWIFVRGLGACAGGPGIKQFALLRYVGSNQNVPPNANQNVNGPPRILNAPNAFCNSSSPNALCVSQIRGAIAPPLRVIQNSRRKTLVIAFGFYTYSIQELFRSGTYRKYYIPVVVPNNPLILKALVNNISYTSPPAPILTQINDIPEESYCPRRCYQGYGDPANCDCFNFYSAPLGDTIIIVVTDTAPYDVNGLTHPFHLHGYDFYVLEMGVFAGDYDTSLRALLNRINSAGINSQSPPLKDTIGVPSGGYAVIAIYADNPGYWLFHCHFLYHLEMGMAAVLQTGDRSEMNMPPPGFPRCQNFKPDVVV